MILKNQRQELMAQLIAKGESNVQAMLQAYPERQKWQRKAQDTAAYKLMASGEILERVREIQEEMKEETIDYAKEVVDLLRRIGVEGEKITDFYEDSGGGRKKARTISRAWALERLCKMLGLDKPTELNVKQSEPEMSREDMLLEIERLQKTREQ